MRVLSNHAWRAAALFALVSSAVACADKSFTPPLGSTNVKARLNIVTSIAAQTTPASGQTLRVLVDYPTDTAIASGNGLGFVDTSVVVSSGTASLSIPIDISHCISAEQVFGAGFEEGTCELIIFVGLFDANQAVLSDTAFLYSVKPGVTPPPISISLNPAYTLTFAPGPTSTGTGTITASPPGLLYPPGTVVTLTATPAAGSSFTGWSGDCTGTGACVVTMNTNKVVFGTFIGTPTFSGTFSGNLGNFATPSGACVSNASLSGNQSLSLTENANGTVTGTATGVAVVNAVGVSGTNCTVSGGTFPFTLPVTGTDASMAWGSTGPPFNMQFSGHRTGNTITGSLTTQSIFQVSDSAGSKADTLLVTIPNVTLTRVTAAATQAPAGCSAAADRYAAGGMQAAQGVPGRLPPQITAAATVRSPVFGCSFGAAGLVIATMTRPSLRRS